MTYLVSYYDYILGDLEDDLDGDLEAEGHVQRALKLNPSIFEGILQIVVGCDLEDDLDGDLEAEGHVQRALKLNPSIFEGILQVVVGFDLEDDLGGDLDGDLEAEGHVQRALKLNPWIFDRFFLNKLLLDVVADVVADGCCRREVAP